MKYSEYVKMVKNSVEKNKDLPLANFIFSVLQECNHDVGMMDNIYIVEEIPETIEPYPGLGVCTEKDGVYTIYFVDDRLEEVVTKYTNPYLFICGFIDTARICQKKSTKSK